MQSSTLGLIDRAQGHARRRKPRVSPATQYAPRGDAVCPQRRQTWYKGPTPCPYRCPRPTATSKTTVYIRLVTTRQHTNAPSVTHKAGQTSSRSILMFVYAETPDSYQA
jgi:hypothetical protein